MRDEVGFAIVGLGMGRDRAEKCQETAGAQLVAVCDSCEKRGRAAEEALSVEWIQDYEDVLTRDDIDVVGLWPPSGMHGSMAVEALNAGKHVCMTKPMDIHVDACNAAIQAAEVNDLVLAIDFESRYKAINHQIRDALNSGAIGDIIFGDLQMKWFRSQDYYDSGQPPGWRSRTETEGGSLANQAAHYVDLLQWWLGPVERVVGSAGTFAHNIETEDASISLLQFVSGVQTAVLTTTCSFPDLGSAIEITGTRGTMSWKGQELTIFEAVKPPGVDDSHRGDSASHRSVSAVSPYVRSKLGELPASVQLNPEDFAVPKGLPANIIEDMVGAVRDGKPVQCDGYEGRKTVQIIEAVYESSRTGDWTEIV